MLLPPLNTLRSSSSVASLSTSSTTAGSKFWTETTQSFSVTASSMYLGGKKREPSHQILEEENDFIILYEEELRLQEKKISGALHEEIEDYTEGTLLMIISRPHCRDVQSCP